MHYILAWVYWVQGEFDRALAEERLELERRGDTVLLAALEEGLDAGGPKGAMRAMAEALAARASDAYVDPFEVGKTFARAACHRRSRPMKSRRSTGSDQRVGLVIA